MKNQITKFNNITNNITNNTINKININNNFTINVNFNIKSVGSENLDDLIDDEKEIIMKKGVLLNLLN
jgi:hypothetical protein